MLQPALVSPLQSVPVLRERMGGPLVTGITLSPFLLVSMLAWSPQAVKKDIKVPYI